MYPAVKWEAPKPRVPLACPGIQRTDELQGWSVIQTNKKAIAECFRNGFF